MIKRRQFHALANHGTYFLSSNLSQLAIRKRIVDKKKRSSSASRLRQSSLNFSAPIFCYTAFSSIPISHVIATRTMYTAYRKSCVFLFIFFFFFLMVCSRDAGQKGLSDTHKSEAYIVGWHSKQRSRVRTVERNARSAAGDSVAVLRKLKSTSDTLSVPRRLSACVHPVAGCVQNSYEFHAFIASRAARRETTVLAGIISCGRQRLIQILSPYRERWK